MVIHVSHKARRQNVIIFERSIFANEFESIAAQEDRSSSAWASAYRFDLAISRARSCATLTTAFPEIFLFAMSANAAGTLSNPS
jgi:hypothetical protein